MLNQYFRGSSVLEGRYNQWGIYFQLNKQQFVDNLHEWSSFINIIIRKATKNCMAEKYLNNYDGIILGYYPLRGKMQVCRLLCEYLHLQYKNLLFTPQTWQQFKKTQKINWNYQQIPFLKDKQVVVTETYPICLYILHKSNRQDLLGQNLKDQAKVDMFLWESQLMSQVLCLMTSLKDQSKQKKIQIFQKFWNDIVKQKLIKLEKQATNSFFLSYISIVDFFIYEVFYFFKKACPAYVSNFPKLIQIFNRVANIPEVVAYQNSTKAIKNICPAEFCQQWKSKCVKQTDKKRYC